MRVRRGVRYWRARSVVVVLLVATAVWVLGASSTSATEVINTIEVGNEPWGVSSDGTDVWVAMDGEGKVKEIEASTAKVIRTIEVPGKNPRQISADGKDVWVTDAFEETVSEIEASTGVVIHNIKITKPGDLSSDGKDVWVIGAENEVSEIEASTAKVINTVKVGSEPSGISADGTHVWVTNYAEHTVSEIEASTAKVISTIKVGCDPGSVSSDGTHVWVTRSKFGSCLEAERVVDIEASTGKIIHEPVVGASPESVSADGTDVWVASYAEGKVDEIKASTAEVIHTVNVGSEPIGISSDGTHVWVANFGSRSVSEILIEEVPPPLVEPGPVEPSDTGATFNADINPNGSETKCTVEYGATSGYGKSTSCGSIPAGHVSVPVHAEVSGLTEATLYHYRILATNGGGTTDSEDLTFDTLQASTTQPVNESKEATVTCSGCTTELASTVSGGTGSITVGEYKGGQIGGPPLPAAVAQERSSAKAQLYQDVHTSPSSDFTKVEIKSQLRAAREGVYWYEPNKGWERPSALSYSKKGPPTATITVTAQSEPSLAQLNGTRFGYGEGEGSVGRCVATKHGDYKDAACTEFGEAGKEPVAHKGKYEWYPLPVHCFPKKDGHYSDSGCTHEEFKESRGSKKYTGTYEKFSGSTGSGDTVEVAMVSSGKVALKCSKITTEEAPLSSGGLAIDVTLTGCEHESKACASGASTGTISGELPETSAYQEGSGGELKAFITWGGAPLLSFSCGQEKFTLSGQVSGLTTGSNINTMSGSSDETVFSGETADHDQQELTLNGSSVTLTTTLTTSSTEPFELDTHAV